MREDIQRLNGLCGTVATMEKESQEEGSKKLVRNDQIIEKNSSLSSCNCLKPSKKMVGERRFELPASWSRTKRATKLRYSPNRDKIKDLSEMSRTFERRASTEQMDFRHQIVGSQTSDVRTERFHELWSLAADRADTILSSVPIRPIDSFIVRCNPCDCFRSSAS